MHQLSAGKSHACRTYCPKIVDAFERQNLPFANVASPTPPALLTQAPRRVDPEDLSTCVCAARGCGVGGGAGERPQHPIYITLKRTPAGSSQREGASERGSKRRPHSPRSRFWHMIKAHRESSEGTPKAAQGAPGTAIQRRYHVGTPGDSTKERTGHRRTHPFLDDARMGASSE